MYNSQEVAKLIKELTFIKGIRINTLLSECNLSKNTLSSMQSGGYYPRVEALCKIADYLEVSVDYLLGRTDKGESSNAKSTLKTISQINRPTTAPLSKDETNLLQTYKLLTNEGKKKAADYVDDLATNPKYKSDDKIKLYPEAAFDRSRTVEEGPYTEEQLHEINDPKNRAEIDNF